MLILKFLGTRGCIEESSPKHRHYSALLIEIPKKKILVDCGEKRFLKEKPDKIIISHLHPDHVQGLEEPEKYLLKKPIKINGLKIIPFSVLHSILAPAHGFRFEFKKFKFGCFPDVLWIKQREKALKDLDLYIGDGASVNRNLVRKNKKTGQLFGHSNIKTQISWCKKFKIPWAIFTHFGKQAIEMDERILRKTLQEYGGGEVKVEAAYDNMEIKISKLKVQNSKLQLKAQNRNRFKF